MHPEMCLDSAIGWKSLLFQAIIVNEFRLVYQQPRKSKGVRKTGAVLTDNNGTTAIVKSDDVLIRRRLNNRSAKTSGRLLADDIVDIFHISPSFQSGKQSGDGVGQAVFVGRNDNATSGASHALHITKEKGSGDAVGLASTATGYNHADVGSNELSQTLRVIEID